MAQQGKPLPPQLLGNPQHIVGIVGQGITRPRRAMLRVTMPGQVQGDDAQALQPRRQAGEAVGVVQPAVQGDHRQAVLGAEQVSSQLDMTQAEADFLHVGTHAWPQRSNRPLIRLAVSVGRSRGNMCPPGTLWYSPLGMPRTASVWWRRITLLRSPRTIANGT
ncbi:hypothetical protein D3C79_720500 [compost metagenome]